MLTREISQIIFDSKRGDLPQHTPSHATHHHRQCCQSGFSNVPRFSPKKTPEIPRLFYVANTRGGRRLQSFTFSANLSLCATNVVFFFVFHWSIFIIIIIQDTQMRNISNNIWLKARRSIPTYTPTCYTSQTINTETNKHVVWSQEVCY